VRATLAAVLLALLASARLCAAQHPRVGAPAPDFVLVDLHGDSARLSQFRGHAVVLKFWASWCPTCRTEMPELLAARDAHRDVGLVVLTVDSDERPSHISRYLAKIPGVEDLPVLLDGNRRVQDLYRIMLLPTTMFIDSAGIVRGIHAGALEADSLVAGLRDVLEPHS